MELPFVESNESADKIHLLYRREIARFRFEPGEGLEGALRTVFAKHVGPRALFLYSEPQVYYIKSTTSAKDSEIETLSGGVEKRIRHLANTTYQLARYVQAIKEPDEVGFRFSILLRSQTMEQLHACAGDGLKQSIFGRKVLEATLWVPHGELVEPDGRKEATQAIRAAVWGGDDLSLPQSRFEVPKYNAASVKKISWQRSINGRH